MDQGPVTPYVDLNLKKLETWGVDTHAALSAWASAAHPVALSSPSLSGRMTTDGGVVDVTPLRTAIQRGATRVIVVTVSSAHVGEGSEEDEWKPSWWERTFKLVGRTLREIEILSEQAQRDDIKLFQERNHTAYLWEELYGEPHPRFRRIEEVVIRPKRALQMTKLKFIKDEFKRGIEIGYESAIEALRPF